MFHVQSQCQMLRYITAIKLSYIVIHIYVVQTECRMFLERTIYKNVASGNLDADLTNSHYIHLAYEHTVPSFLYVVHSFFKVFCGNTAHTRYTIYILHIHKNEFFFQIDI